MRSPTRGPRHAGKPRVLFATAEYAPVVKVGGLSEASSGLVGFLRSLDVDVEVVMPDHGLVPLENERIDELDQLPQWMPPVRVRTGWHPDAGPITLLRYDGSERPSPYVDPATGEGWPDNPERYLRFSAAVARVASTRRIDVVHCNDWHSAAAVSLLPPDTASVLTVHNLAHQGSCDPEWSSRLGVHGVAFLEGGACNPLAGGVSLADRVVLVSETYAAEARRPDAGCGLHHRLVARGQAVRGIRNGIDLGLWDPAEDPLLPVTFDPTEMSGKEICRKDLLRVAGLEPGHGPVIGIVARFVHQKGIDLALELAPFLEAIDARLVLIGMGAPEITALAQDVAERHPAHVAVLGGYDEQRAHLVVAGSDLFLVPSRFEPCGLTQMQAMTCGTIPVVSPVGGLRDTVTDADDGPATGNGFVARSATPLGLLDAVHRAMRAWSEPARRREIQLRGMTADWSWGRPARAYLELYEEIVAATSAR